MPKLLPSELILSSEGRVYHLDLRPDEIADTVILVGDPARVERVSRHFDRIDLRRTKREFTTHTGALGGKRLTVLSTGIGTDNIDIVLNELDALANIDFSAREVRQELRSLDLIRLGTTGGLQTDLPVDTVVYSAYAIGLDNLLHYYSRQPSDQEQQLAAAFPHHQLPSTITPYFTTANQPLLQQLLGTSQAGITLTASGFYGPQGRRMRLSSNVQLDSLIDFRYRDLAITNLEMETAGIYGLSKLLGHRAVSASVILANRSLGTFSKDAKGAVDRMIEEVLEQLV